MNDVGKSLLAKGDVRAARRWFEKRLMLHPDDEEARLMHGTCCGLSGDTATLVRVDEELSKSPTARRLPQWPAFHALRVAACGAAMLLAVPAAAGDIVLPLYGGPRYEGTLYAAPWYSPINRADVPTPVASDGKYSGYVKLTWKAVPNAVRYRVRRATKPDYSKSKSIAVVTGTSYKDRHPECNPKKRYYYWIVPYNGAGKGRKSENRYDSGYARQTLSISLPDEMMYVGGRYGLQVQGHPCQLVNPEDCTWRVVSGSSRATISKKGVLKAKKAGKVVVSATYNGRTVKVTIRIYQGGEIRPTYGIACYRDNALERVEGPDFELFVMPSERLA